MDILGPFLPAVGQVKFLKVAIDYVTKWIKVMLMEMIITQGVKRFYWKKLICQFGVSETTITDNDT